MEGIILILMGKGMEVVVDMVGEQREEEGMRRIMFRMLIAHRRRVPARLYLV